MSDDELRLETSRKHWLSDGGPVTYVKMRFYGELPRATDKPGQQYGGFEFEIKRNGFEILPKDNVRVTRRLYEGIDIVPQREGDVKEIPASSIDDSILACFDNQNIGEIIARKPALKLCKLW